MPRYFYDMVDGVHIVDAFGRIVTGGDEAIRSEAVSEARKLIAAAALEGADISGRRYEIMDEGRAHVMTVQFASALTLEPSLTRNSAAHLLTPREREVLSWVSQGKTSRDIAQILELSRRTVEHYITTSMEKLDAVNRLQAVTEAIRLGEI